MISSDEFSSPFSLLLMGPSIMQVLCLILSQKFFNLSSLLLVFFFLLLRLGVFHHCLADC